MEKEKLIFWRNFLVRIFILGLGFAIILIAGTVCVWDWWSGMVTQNMHIEEKDLGIIMVSTILYLRLFLIFIVLVPAIALHLMVRKSK